MFSVSFGGTWKGICISHTLVPVEAVVSSVPGTIVGNPHGRYAEEESPTFLYFYTQSQHFLSTLQVDQDRAASWEE